MALDYVYIELGGKPTLTIFGHEVPKNAEKRWGRMLTHLAEEGRTVESVHELKLEVGKAQRELAKIERELAAQRKARNPVELRRYELRVALGLD